MKYFKFTIICLACVLSSCKHREDSPAGHPVLKVELKERPVSIFDIFKSVEIIPLETTSESLFANLDKIEVLGETFFIFDYRTDAVLMFDSSGRYIDKIQRVGRGPGEYTMVYDFIADQDTRTIKLLEPMGAIFTYDFEGNFIKRDELPIPPPSYWRFEKFDDETYVTFSFAADDDAVGVNFVDAETMEIRRGFFPYNTLWASMNSHRLLQRYDGKVYYYENMAHKVYRINSDGYEVAYEWDPGIEIIDPEELRPNVRWRSNQTKEFNEYFRAGGMPYYYEMQSQTKKYYYSQMLFTNPFRRINLFYDKATGESVCFKMTTEGFLPEIRYMNDEFAIGYVLQRDIEKYQAVVSTRDAELLKTRKEDDNKWLIKYTFK